MSGPIGDLATLLRSLEPELHDGVYVYAQLPAGADVTRFDAVASVREREGISVILHEDDAARAGLVALFRARWITLTVHSDLEAVGLTAAFARALADVGIACNVIAGAVHDHVFVQAERAEDALAALRALQARSA